MQKDSTRAERLQKIITEKFQPTALEIVNESHMHAVPAHSETHFKALIVSKAFDGVSRVDRQRAVLSAIDAELKSGLHAFTMRALTPDEHARNGSETFQSPPCASETKRS